MSVSPVRTAARCTEPKHLGARPVNTSPPPVLSGDSIALRSRSSAHEPIPSRALDSGPAVPPTRRDALVAALLARVPRADRAAAQTAIPAILDAAHASGSSDPNRIAYLLATAQTESDFGAHMTETGHSRTWFERVYGGEDGNRPGTSDGYTYRGRGYVQITRAGRYAEISHRLGLADIPAPHDAANRASGPAMQPALVARPEALTEPHVAARALVIGVNENLFTHNAAVALDKTIPVGKPPGAVDFYHARGLVNGIVAAQARSLSAHATIYARILDGYRHSVLGVVATR